MQWPRELAGVRTNVSFSAVNNLNKPQTGVKVSLSDQHDFARAKHRATNSLPMKILFLPFVGKSLPITIYLFVFIRLQHAPYESVRSRALHNKLRVSSVKWKVRSNAASSNNDSQPSIRELRQRCVEKGLPDHGLRNTLIVALQQHASTNNDATETATMADVPSTSVETPTVPPRERQKVPYWTTPSWLKYSLSSRGVFKNPRTR